MYFDIQTESVTIILCCSLLFHGVGTMTNQRTKTEFYFLSLSKGWRTVTSPSAICSEPIGTENSCMEDAGMTDR